VDELYARPRAPSTIFSPPAGKVEKVGKFRI